MVCVVRICFARVLGLKTAKHVNMFAILRFGFAPHIVYTLCLVLWHVLCIRNFSSLEICAQHISVIYTTQYCISCNFTCRTRNRRNSRGSCLLFLYAQMYHTQMQFGIFQGSHYICARIKYRQSSICAVVFWSHRTHSAFFFWVFLVACGYIETTQSYKTEVIYLKKNSLVLQVDWLTLMLRMHCPHRRRNFIIIYRLYYLRAVFASSSSSPSTCVVAAKKKKKKHLFLSLTHLRLINILAYILLW